MIVSRVADQKVAGSVRLPLLVEVERAYDEFRQCMVELGKVLAQPHVDRARLTTIRLKIAQLRLARGALVSKVSAQLADKASSAELAQLKRMRESHDQMLRAAAAHTAKWTLDAVDANWAQYKAATRQIAQLWTEKMKTDQEFICSLLRRP